MTRSSLSYSPSSPSAPSFLSLSVLFLSLSPTGLEKAILHEFLCKNINSINTLNEFGRRSSPAELLMKPQPWPILGL